MAENEENKEQETQAQEGEASTEKKGFPKMLIIMGAGGVLVVGLVVTTLLLVLGGDETDTVAANSAEQSEEEKPKKADKEEGDKTADGASTVGSPQFYPIRPAIVVNIPSNGKIRFLQIQVDIMSRDDDVIDDIEAYAPLIKNELVTLFSNQKYEEMVTPEGKEKLRKEALVRIQKVMSDQAGVEGIEQVLFTSFVTQ